MALHKSIIKDNQSSANDSSAPSSQSVCFAGKMSPKQNRKNIARVTDVTPSSPTSKTNTSTSNKKTRVITCFYCKKPNHVISQCRLKKKHDAAKLKADAAVVEHVNCIASDVVPIDSMSDTIHPWFKPFCTSAIIVSPDGCRHSINVLRDTGALQSLLRVGSVPSTAYRHTGDKRLIRGVGKSPVEVPLVEIHMLASVFDGPVLCALIDHLPDGVDFLLGNDLWFEIQSISDQEAFDFVVTRSMAREAVSSHPPVVGNSSSHNDIEQMSKVSDVVDPDWSWSFSKLFETSSSLSDTDNQLGTDDHNSLQANSSSSLPRAGANAATSNAAPATEQARLLQTLGNDLQLHGVTSTEQFCSLQKADAQLNALRNTVLHEPFPVAKSYLYEKNDLLMRHWYKPNSLYTAEQLVVPSCLRSQLLQLSHDIPASGHLGIAKTKERLLAHFWWPKCHKHIIAYVRSCDRCQRIGKGLHPRAAPLVPLPVVSEPFSLVAIDIVGPLPTTASKNRFILTVFDMATHYPEAIPLQSHTASDVATALSEVFCRHGLPDRILSDQGTDFMSHLMQIFLHDFSISQIRTSPYHPQSNASLERFHKTLKGMIRCLADKFDNNWDACLKWALFAYREIPVESLGYSPFELLYGRQARGPLSLLKTTWAKGLTDLSSAKQNVVAYLLDLRQKLKEIVDTAVEHNKRAKTKSKTWYDKRARERTFAPGDLVLALLPSTKDPLGLKYQGPYRIIEKVGPVDYILETPGRRKSTALLHVNLLKRYVTRDIATNSYSSADAKLSIPHITDDELIGHSGCWFTSADPSATSAQLVQDQFNLQHLSSDCRKELAQLLSKYPKLFNDNPGKTDAIVHHIELQPGTRPIKMSPYRVNPEKAELIRKELDLMKSMGVIEDSTSPWGSPVVLIPKPDGSIRFCVDYRKLNDKTLPDAHPLPRIDDLIDKVGKAKFMTKIDLSRGYWQVPLDDQSVPVSAFVTPFGHFQWRYMPFGLRNAPATFQRLIWKVLSGLEEFTGAYLDDIIIFSSSWSEHLKHLRLVFGRLQSAGLTLKKSKCVFATAVVDYLGHTVGLGQVQPREAKVQALLKFPRPANRKQLQSFLGLAGYYRRYIPHFALLSASLTNMLRKGHRFVWSPEAEDAYLEIKSRLASRPVLRPPDFTRPFCIGVDASDVAIGAYLFQVYDNVEHPVCYYSKRLSKCQQRYSTVEKEAFALLSAVRTFRVYFGTHVVTVYTDHSPLQFIQRMANHNDKLLRYSLELQQYNIHIVHRSGKQNIIPDILSRPSA